MAHYERPAGWREVEDECWGKKALVYCTQMTEIISVRGQEKWPESGLSHKLLSLEVCTIVNKTLSEIPGAF